MLGSGNKWSCVLSSSWDENRKQMFDEIFQYYITNSDLKAVVTVGKEVEIAFLNERALRDFVAAIPDDGVVLMN